MRRIRNWWIVLAGTVAISGCGASGVGDFCDTYTQVGMTRAGAVAIVRADRRAAERIEINESLHERCD